MGKKSLLPLVCLMLFPFMALGTDPTYSNTGIIAYWSDQYADTVPYLPNIDATNFYNSGIWDVYTLVPQDDWLLGVGIPYETDHTLNYTNTGTMTGSIGWEFDYGPLPLGGRGMAASFFNDSRGTIEAVDGAIANPANELTHTNEISKLLITATNIVNKGTLIAGPGGQLVLNGENVHLARSTLEISPLVPVGSVNNFSQTNFTPDTAIYDVLWKQTNGTPTGPFYLNSPTLWNGTVATSPTFYVDGLCAILDAMAGIQVATLPPFGLADSTNVESPLYLTNIVYTNASLRQVTAVNYTKIFRQAVFVDVSDPNLVPPDDRFFPNSDNRSNLFQAITVKLTSTLSGDSIYLEDDLGSLTNRGLLLNAAGNVGNNPVAPCTDPTYRPANYVVSRLDPQGHFAFGAPGLGPPTNNFFFQPNFTNTTVQADYSAYEPYVDNLVRDYYGTDVTNKSGRIVINATNLDLTRTTIHNSGAEVVIQANNFEGSTSAVVYCQNLSYNLGMTNAPGTVNVTNLASITGLPAINGYIFAWSAIWTNGMTTLYTNYVVSTNTEGGTTVSNFVFTNITEMDFHALLLEATPLSATVPELVQDLIVQTNAVISDSMDVVHTLLFNGQSVTLLGTLNLSGNLQDWNSSITPTWLYFTNNGTLAVPENAHFGDDGPTNYAAFVNNGTISVSGGETINSVYYQSSGNENAPGGYSVATPNGKIQNGAITSGQDMKFTGGVLKLDHATLVAGNTLYFTLTNALYDSGGSANNTLTCGAGFSLSVKPATGDLLGTAITAQAPDNAVNCVWAGEDRGAGPSGYSNNVALGQLFLSPQSGDNNLFYFSGPDLTHAYAMYVDLLDLSKITDLTEMVETDPNFVIYYAAAKLPSTVTVLSSNGVPVQEVETNIGGIAFYIRANGGSGQVPQEPEEVLNGQLYGNLRWVTNFAGPNSSVDVIINGQTYAVNRALRYSLTIDSNGNGIPNYYDPNPFNTVPLVLTGSLVQTNPPPAKAFAISWTAQPNVPYQVQFNTNMLGANWQPLLNYTNSASTNRAVTVWDTNAVLNQRFYRVLCYTNAVNQP